MNRSIYPHHQSSRATRVTLSCQNLDRSIKFYERIIGLHCLLQETDRALMGFSNDHFLELLERPKAQRDRDAAGLFHFAVLMPSRIALGSALDRLWRHEAKLTGAADHIVSEAIYLDDPDGHGIELYRDRPEQDWYRDGVFTLSNEPLDLSQLRKDGSGSMETIDSVNPILGHVHFEVADPASASLFYRQKLDMKEMATRPQASFLSWSGYHHHLAFNCWNHRSANADSEYGIGLVSVDLAVDDIKSPSSLVDGSGIRLNLIPITQKHSATQNEFTAA